MTQEVKWWWEAECRYVGLELFFPEGKGDNLHHSAKRICAVCPVVDECLDSAMSEERSLRRDHRHGVRGGLTARERFRLALERGETVTESDDNGAAA